MSTEHTPYLVQRILERKEASESKGVDRHFRFDYMGSSEFEWGALPKALEAMRSACERSWKPVQLKVGDHVVWYVGPENLKTIAKNFFQDQLWWPSGSLRLKEPADIANKYGARDGYHEEFLCGWWDIGSVYALFTKKDHAHDWLKGIRQT